jgi:hypothetical protein
MKRALIGVLVLLLAGCGVQPTDPINGNRSAGVMLYLVLGNSPVPVLRTSRYELKAGDALTLLAGSPTGPERDMGLTTEVPAAAVPITIEGNTISLQVDPNTLSALAVAQIACTAAIPGPVTLTGGGQSRGSVTCPV